METKKIIETYMRYLQTIEDLNSNLITNYLKITKFLNDNCNDGFLHRTILLHCIGRVVQEIKKRDIRIKDSCTEGWSRDVTKEGFRLLRSIKEHQYDFDNSTFITSFKSFKELAMSQNPHLELYLWYCFYNQIGDKLFRISMSQIEEAAANAINAEENAADEETNERETTA